MDTLNLLLADEAATEQLAQQLAPLLCTSPSESNHTLSIGGRIHLYGDLGAGKTTFARALLRACGVTGRIKSPSYALIESYNVSNFNLYHLDFYRFHDNSEWLDAGFRDILHENNIVLIEWPQRAGNLLPAPDLELRLEYAEGGRKATLIAYSERGKRWLTKLATHSGH